MVISESHDRHRHSGRPTDCTARETIHCCRSDKTARLLLLLIDFITVILYAIFYGVNCVNKCI